jgi:hypothetical protein
MKLNHFVFLVLAGVIFNSCLHEVVRHPLFFESANFDQRTDFIHITPNNEPFSIEVMGRADTVGSMYRYNLQVGIYGSPAFNKDDFQLMSEALKIQVDDFALQSLSSKTVESHNKPWALVSSHWFFCPVDSLLDKLRDSSALKLVISFDGYFTYNHQSVDIEPIIALDPWFKSNEIVMSKSR